MNIFNKLNLKNQSEIVVVNAPQSFEKELESLTISVQRDASDTINLNFALAFVTKQDELNSITKTLISKAKGDATLWFAYPKQSSKRYTCDFNRDTGWVNLGEASYEPVRQVAIDEDWSALRFRHVDYIKTMKRDPKHALSSAGKNRTGL